MKKNLLCLLAVACIAVTSQLISCKSSYDPVRTDEPALHSRYDSSRYVPDEIIVVFKDPPSDKKINDLKKEINGPYFDASKLKTRKCNSCDGYVELWQAPQIHTRIHAQGLVAGTKSPGGSQPVGEDGLGYYSLNFKQNIPMDFLGEQKLKYDSLIKVENNKGEKEVVRIAVLDTGIDTARIVGASYLWTNPANDADNKCYTGDKFGWNFINNSGDVHDDNLDHHGTLVSHYIINQFTTSDTKAVELMTLKTHDGNGDGDLFHSICAIHYAMEKGAQIINASWGFYYYQDRPHPYLDYLITDVLRKKGILFVAAAGNKIPEADKFAHEAYRAAHSGADIPDSYLRDLDCHNFYPACLSNANNNVVTVTTADETRVSASQNYSSKYVDLGAIPDDNAGMRFAVPFVRSAGATGPVTTISGSSFAAAIVTGKIGAFLSNSAYASNIDKRDVLPPMETAGLITKSPALQADHIREGRITPHN
jgi:hypothetical protein